MPPATPAVSNDGEGLGPLQNPLLRVVHPLSHSNGTIELVQQVPAWVDTPENIVRVRKTLLDLLGCE